MTVYTHIKFIKSDASSTTGRGADADADDSAVTYIQSTMFYTL